MIFAYPLSDSDMQCHLAPALLGWGVGKYIAASTSHLSARAWCRIGSGPVHTSLFASVNMPSEHFTFAAGLPLLAGLAAMAYTGDWNLQNTVIFSGFGAGTVYFGYIV
jgi:hypothetical protein